ncbi:MAG TPA: PAS domain S-box protein [Nitrospira sp.]|nr:PAS domain S-box protein [Nitrospira sp.]
MVTAGGRYSVLVVEDNPDIIVALEDLLHHDGYEVTEAGTCAAAIALISQQRFNAILLDLGLPDGDGIDVLKEVQRRDASLPVIIITAHIAQDRTVGSLGKGAFAYLTKPYNREELRQTLRRAIGVKELAAKAARAEQSLTESEHRFQSLVESATDGIVVANGRGVVISCNRAASRLFGYSTDELIGQPLTLIMPDRYREAHERGMARIEATGKGRLIGSVVELHGLRKSGEEFPIELSLATWKTAHGSYYSGIIRDISERKKAAQALEQLQHQHTLILTQAGEGIYGLDNRGSTTFVNASAAGMLGYAVEELLGRHMHDLLHHTKPDGTPYPVDECPIYAAINDGEIHRVIDEIFWRKNGTAFPVEYVSTPITEGDRVVGAVIVFRDITARKEVESALKASEERLEMVIQGSTDGFWDTRLLPNEPWTSPRTPVWWSPRVKTMLGYTDDEFPDLLDSWTKRLHPDDRDRVFAAITAHIERRVPYDEEYRLLTRSGDYHWVRARGQAVWDAEGRVTRMSGSLQSIMERKRAEDALRRSQELLRAMADNTTAVIYVKEASGRYLLVNRRFEDIFGLKADQILGFTDHQIFPRHFADVFRSNDVEVLERNATLEYEETAPHLDGPHTYISIKFPLRDQAGIPYALCGVSTDITERKQAEDLLRSHEQQLRQALTSTEIGLWSWNIESDSMFWSPQVDEFLGMPPVPGHKTPRGLLALVHPADREAITRATRQVMEPSRRDITFQHRVKRSDGMVLSCIWIGHIVRDHSGKALHVLGTVRSISSLHEQAGSEDEANI